MRTTSLRMRLRRSRNLANRLACASDTVYTPQPRPRSAGQQAGGVNATGGGATPVETQTRRLCSRFQLSATLIVYASPRSFSS